MNTGFSVSHVLGQLDTLLSIDPESQGLFAGIDGTNRLVTYQYINDHGAEECGRRLTHSLITRLQHIRTNEPLFGRAISPINIPNKILSTTECRDICFRIKCLDAVYTLKIHGLAMNSQQESTLYELFRTGKYCTSLVYDPQFRQQIEAELTDLEDQGPALEKPESYAPEYGSQAAAAYIPQPAHRGRSDEASSQPYAENPASNPAGASASTAPTQPAPVEQKSDLVKRQLIQQIEQCDSELPDTQEFLEKARQIVSDSIHKAEAPTLKVAEDIISTIQDILQRRGMSPKEYFLLERHTLAHSGASVVAESWYRAAPLADETSGDPALFEIHTTSGSIKQTFKFVYHRTHSLGFYAYRLQLSDPHMVLHQGIEPDDYRTLRKAIAEYLQELIAPENKP